MVDYGLKGRTAIITGAGSGIGRETAKQIAAQGCAVAVLDFNISNAEAAAEEINTAGFKAIPVKCDVKNEADVKSAADNVFTRFGRIDILVNNAGIEADFSKIDTHEPDWFTGKGDGLNIPIDEYDRVVNTNMRGHYLMMKHVCPYMIEAKFGRVVNVSSTTVYSGSHGSTPYVASKAGIILQTRNIAHRLGKYNITVNAVAPGMVDTPMHDTTPRDQFKFAPFGIPLGRIAQPIDIARAILFFTSDELYVTGQTLVVDGGGTMK